MTSLVLATFALTAAPLLAAIDADIVAADRNLVRPARAQHNLNCVHQLIVLRQQCVPDPIRQGTVPLEHIAVYLLCVALVQSRSATGRSYRHVHVHCLVETLLQLVQNVVVRRLLIERQHEHLLQAIVQVAWYHAEELSSVSLLQALLQVVLEVHILVLEHLVEVGPGQSLIVQKVDKYVKSGFDVVSARLCVPPASVQRGK